MISFIAKPEIKKFLNQNLSKWEISPSGKYITNEYKHRTFNIKLYSTNLITISGNKELDIYNKFIEILNEDNYIGMDEVGVGDFFGPTVYVATKLTSESKGKLHNLILNIKDSKKLKDEEIINIYSKIKNIIDYSVQIVYDKDIDTNLNSIDQKMFYHYENYKLIKFENEKKVIIDLFTTENNFYKVANKLNTNFGDKLILETKADSKYFVVALASIIARYHFIQEMNNLNDKYNFKFPYGANIKNTAQDFVNIYSKDELAKFCKITFKTFNELD